MRRRRKVEKDSPRNTLMNAKIKNGISEWFPVIFPRFAPGKIAEKPIVLHYFACFAGKQNPVAISNVFVGSLGNYGPMSNVVDIGPVLDTAFEYPESGQTNEATYQVDYTNVFYELVIPDIWINPIEAYACVGDTNPVQFTVYGTNIPQGVTWTINPEGVGATIQTNENWHIAEVTPGDIGTNYKVRATSVDNANFYDEVSLYVCEVESIEASCPIATNSPQFFEGGKTNFGDPCSATETTASMGPISCS